MSALNQYYGGAPRYPDRISNLTRGQKGALTKDLRKMFPLSLSSGSTQTKNRRKLDQFSENQQMRALQQRKDVYKTYVQRLHIWNKVAVVKYLNYIEERSGRTRRFQYSQIPDTLVEQMMSNKYFIEFKKRLGYRLLYHKVKQTKVKPTERELNLFIQMYKNN
jgi:hypothetical protein